jgi:hypothetical protein
MYFNNLFNDFFPFRNSYSFRPQTAHATPYHEEPRDPKIMMCQKILSDKSNYLCFDCGCQLNELNYFDLKNAIFLCYNCALQHQKYPKEISEVVTGNIRTLDHSYLIPLYYGGNKSLIDFIRNNYPLLEKKGRKNIYTSRALDYYRKLIWAKVNNQREPCKPSILDGYNSIYSERPKYNNRTYVENNEENMRCEPADINKGKNNEDNDVEMTDENCNSNNNESDVNTSQDSGSEECNNKKKINTKPNNKEVKKKSLNLNLNKEKVEMKQKKEIFERCLTLNQLGNLNMYPDAKAIDDMDC